MKKQKVHFSFCHGCALNTACGADVCSGLSGKLKITDHRNRVTCKSCKATKRFMMKKKKVHFSLRYDRVLSAACGADMFSDLWGGFEVTNNRKAVTCKSCRATRIFRKIK